MNKKSDPNRIVTTAFGKTAIRKECRAIKGNFYKMNEECFKFNGRWYRINSGFLVEDISTGKWILKDSNNIICGLALGKNGVVTTGYFVRNLFTNIPVHVDSIPQKLLSDITTEGETVYAHNLSVVRELKLVEDIPTGIFMTKEKASNKIAIGGSYNFKIDYSFENSGSSIKDAFLQHSKKMDANVKYSKLLNGLTFGWEFETTDGFVHPRHLMKTGLIPLRDGSIPGYEYVTCPLVGDVGLQTTMNSARVLQKYTTNNISCSLHLHLGNIPVNGAFLVEFFKVCKVVQNDIYRMFPASMDHTSKYKERDYCNKLPKLSKGFSDLNAEKIVNWAAGKNDYFDSPSFQGIGRQAHPDDTGNNRKWAIHQRYLFVNFVNYIFSDRGTMEFRIHTPTTNVAKLINWLYICAGIVNFTKMYASNYDDVSLSKLNLKKILRIVYSKNPEITEYLESYIDWRVSFMKQCNERGDDIGSTEIINDSTFKFPFKGKETFVSNE